MSGATTTGRRRRRRWTFASAAFDEASWILSVKGRPVALESKPLEMLHELLLNAGEVVTKDELLDAVWPGITVVEASLATAISKLRKALGDVDGEVIETVPRIGYRLGVPVAVESLSAPIGPRFSFVAGEAVPGRAQWHLVRALGDSGANDVWLAAHEKTGQTRVFKFADTPEGLRALKREATIARLLMVSLGPDGPFVPLLEWNFETSPYLIESQDGGASLLEWARGNGGLEAFTTARRLAVARSIARALAAVHGAGVLHKDIKPANILIEERDGAFRVRLVDFGSGRVVDGEILAAHAITDLATDEIGDGASPGRSGTLLYRAPELGGDAVPTARSDVYALGLVLFQLIVGDFGRSLAPGWENDVEDPLLRQDIAAAAAGDPERRIGTAAELADRIERLDQRRAEALSRDEADRRLASLKFAEERRLARRPWVRAAAAAALIGIAATSGAAIVANRQREMALRQSAIAEASYRFLADDLLARADPAKADAAEETLADAARRASAEINARFAAEPLVAARLHHSMARAFDQRTEIASARDEYAKAERAYLRAGAAASGDLAIVRLQLAQMEALTGDPNALPRARALLAAVQGVPGTDQGETGVWRASAEGSVALAAEEVPAAQAAYKRAATLADANSDRFSERQRLNLRQRIAFTYLRLGDGKTAESLLRPIADSFARKVGSDHPDTLTLRLNLAQALLVQKKHAQVIDTINRLLPLFESRFGKVHRSTLQLLAVRQQSLGNLERYAEAAADGERLWRATAAREGPTAFQAIAGRVDTATSQCRAGEVATGTENALAALKAARHGIGPETALSMAVRSAVGDCLIASKRYSDAYPYLQGIDRVKVSQLVGDADWGANLDLANAEVALAQHNPALARKFYDAAAPILSNPTSDPYQTRRLKKIDSVLRN